MKTNAKKAFLSLGQAALFFLVYFVAQLLVGSVFMVVYTVGVTVANPTLDYFTLVEMATERYLAATNMITVTANSAVLAIISAIFLIMRKNPLRQVGLKPVRPAFSLWIPLAMGVALQFFMATFLDVLPLPYSLLEEYAESASALENGPLVWELLAVVVLAPLTEEVVLRGLLYSRLKRGLPAMLALILQAVVFGLLHGQLLWVCYTACLAIVLALVYDAYRSLWASVALHFSFNASSYLIQLLTYEQTVWSFVIAGVSGLAAACLGALAWRHWKALPAPEPEPEPAAEAPRAIPAPGAADQNGYYNDSPFYRKDGGDKE